MAGCAGMKVQARLLWASDLHHVGHRVDLSLPFFGPLLVLIIKCADDDVGDIVCEHVA